MICLNCGQKIVLGTKCSSCGFDFRKDKVFTFQPPGSSGIAELEKEIQSAADEDRKQKKQLGYYAEMIGMRLENAEKYIDEVDDRDASKRLMRLLVAAENDLKELREYGGKDITEQSDKEIKRLKSSLEHWSGLFSAEKDRIDAERQKRERDEAERLKKERDEAERLKKERDEAERLKKERDEAERLKKELIEVEQLKKELIEVGRLKKELIGAEPLRKENTDASAGTVSVKKTAMAPKPQTASAAGASGSARTVSSGHSICAGWLLIAVIDLSVLFFLCISDRFLKSDADNMSYYMLVALLGIAFLFNVVFVPKKCLDKEGIIWFGVSLLFLAASEFIVKKNAGSDSIFNFLKRQDTVIQYIYICSFFVPLILALSFLHECTDYSGVSFFDLNSSMKKINGAVKIIILIAVGGVSAFLVLRFITDSDYDLRYFRYGDGDAFMQDYFADCRQEFREKLNAKEYSQVVFGEACIYCLKNDGTVEVIGDKYMAEGKFDYSDWKNITRIEYLGHKNGIAALTENGRVLSKTINTSDWKNVSSIAGNKYGVLSALRSDGTIISSCEDQSLPVNINSCVSLEAAGKDSFIAVLSSGRVVIGLTKGIGEQYQNASAAWTDVKKVAVEDKYGSLYAITGDGRLIYGGEYGSDTKMEMIAKKEESYSSYSDMADITAGYGVWCTSNSDNRYSYHYFGGFDYSALSEWKSPEKVECSGLCFVGFFKDGSIRTAGPMPWDVKFSEYEELYKD